MSKERSNAGRKAWQATLRRTMLRGAGLVSAIGIMVALNVNVASAAWFGGSWVCTGCTVYNHNETLVEDDLAD